MTEFITHFHFIRPQWLLALVPCIVVFILLLIQKRISSQWRSFISPELLPFLTDNHTLKKQTLPLWGLVLGWIIACFSLAGPSWEKQPQPVNQDMSAMVILWDLSPSMNAQDLAPSRLVRARLKLIDILNTRDEGLTGLITYSGEGHIVTPLTDDTNTIINLLEGLNPDIMPSKGSNVEMAFEQAQQLLRDAGVKQGDILIFTDGIASDAIPFLTDLHSQTLHRVTVWSIGTAAGAPIPLPQGGFARSTSNEIVIAKLDERLLSEVAIALNGLYVPFSNSDLDVKTISGFMDDALRSTHRANNREYDKWLERGPYLVLLLLPLVALSFRRGWVLPTLILFGNTTFFTSHTEALEWQDLWQNTDQKAYDLLQSGDAAKATEVFKDKDWQAVANYQQNDWENALQHFQQSNDPTSLYNLGNTLTQLGRYDEAIDAYDKAIKQGITQAEHNKKIAEQLRQIAQQSQQNNEQNSQSNDSEEQNNKQSEQSQNTDNQGDPQSSDQQNSESTDSNQRENGQPSDQQSDQQNNDSTSSEEAEEHASKAQQQALENQYSQNPQSETETNQDEQSPAETQDDETQKEDTESKQLAVSQQEDQTSEEQTSSEQSVLQTMTAEEREQQQALEQWLRKVPDNPSGLIRNKFEHEYRQRRLEQNNRIRSGSGQGQTQRW